MLLLLLLLHVVCTHRRAVESGLKIANLTAIRATPSAPLAHYPCCHATLPPTAHSWQPWQHPGTATAVVFALHFHI